MGFGVKTRLKPGRKATGLQRPIRFPFLINADEKEYIEFKSRDSEMSMSEFLRKIVFPLGWRRDLEFMRSEK